MGPERLRAGALRRAGAAEPPARAPFAARGPASVQPSAAAVASRLVHREDFEALLGTRPIGRSAHFAIHHVQRGPLRRSASRAEARPDELSTDGAEISPKPVDNSAAPNPEPAPTGHWLGVMAPKRHARRAVTRNLVKRLAREAFGRRELALAGGLWLVRLRQPLSRADFVSARSQALAGALHAELDALIGPLAAPPATASTTPHGRPAAPRARPARGPA
ncbi:MAG: ribonuclease P protein component [Rubrivivax sp.]|jgi:ribonuclease P protein component|nr:ribonuclease P protein component [Rubrivivax sp.]MCA3259225.1 ribonuclease P protein component [Rubrivivax sp.]